MASKFIFNKVPKLNIPGNKGIVHSSAELIKDTAADPMRDAVLGRKDREKTASAKDVVSKALKSRLRSGRVLPNQYLTKIAAKSKGFRFVPSTSGIRRPIIKTPAKPGLMKEANMSKNLKILADKAKKVPGKAGDLIGGRQVFDFGEKQLKNRSINTSTYAKSKSYKEKKKIVQNAIKDKPASEQKKIMREMGTLRAKQNVARAAVGTGIGVYAGGTIKKKYDEKQARNRAIEYYRSRGLL